MLLLQLQAPADPDFPRFRYFKDPVAWANHLQAGNAAVRVATAAARWPSRVAALPRFTWPTAPEVDSIRACFGHSLSSTYTVRDAGGRMAGSDGRQTRRCRELARAVLQSLRCEDKTSRLKSRKLLCSGRRRSE